MVQLMIEGNSSAPPLNCSVNSSPTSIVPLSDITSSGETLRANHLKVLSDGLVLKSQATLWRSRVAEVSEADRGTMDALLDRLG